MDIRCDHRLHGRVRGGTLEVSCRSRLCGKAEGVVVLHIFSLASGELIRTDKFKELPTKKGQQGASSREHAPLRAS